MNFGNNIEQLGFEKSGWVIIDQSADGNTVYMGKPSTADAKPADAAWHIRKVTTEVQDDGSQLIMTQHAEPHGKCVWADRKNLEYLPVLKDIRKVRIQIPSFTETDMIWYIKEYSFEHGMTWREWVESEYNIDNFEIKNVFTQRLEYEDAVVVIEDASGGGWHIQPPGPDDQIGVLGDDYNYDYDCYDYFPPGGFGGGGWS